jgi:hypothetical protein
VPLGECIPIDINAADLMLSLPKFFMVLPAFLSKVVLYVTVSQVRSQWGFFVNRFLLDSRI